MTCSYFGGSGQSIQEIDRFLFVLLAEVGIPHSHVHSLVAHEFLQFFHGGTSHDHVTSESVAQILKPETLYPRTSEGSFECRFDTGYGPGYWCQSFSFSERFVSFEIVSAIPKGENILGT